MSTPTAHLSWEGEGGRGSSGGSGGTDIPQDHLEDVAAVTLEAHRKTRRRKWSVSAISAIYLRRWVLPVLLLSVDIPTAQSAHYSVFYARLLR